LLLRQLVPSLTAAPGELRRPFDLRQSGLGGERERLPGGRPRNLDDKKKRHAGTLHGDPTNSVQDICRTLGISKATLYRYLAEQRRR
jgi:hypothetical protein